jgi:hypothetical protein
MPIVTINANQLRVNDPIPRIPLPRTIRNVSPEMPRLVEYDGEQALYVAISIADALYVSRRPSDEVSLDIVVALLGRRPLHQSTIADSWELEFGANPVKVAILGTAFIF